MRINIGLFLALCSLALEAKTGDPTKSGKEQSEALALNLELTQIAKITPHTTLFEDAKIAKKKLNPFKNLTGSDEDLKEQLELMNVIYKGHSWKWYWDNNPEYFLTYFPLFSFLVWGKFPVVYSDFYKLFNYPPATYNMLGFATVKLDITSLVRSKENVVFPQDQCQQTCVRQKVQSCLNESNKGLDVCQSEAIASCSTQCK